MPTSEVGLFYTEYLFIYFNCTGWVKLARETLFKTVPIGSNTTGIGERLNSTALKQREGKF